MALDLPADDLLSTTRAVRRRLDFDRPVEREVLLECVHLATQAPSGSNSQRWHWLFVDDPDKKAALAELYNKVFAVAYSPAALGNLDAAGERVRQSAQYLADHLHEAPVMLLPLSWGTPPEQRAGQAGYWGSLLPAAWSFCLAARNRGLGTTWTTMHLSYEQDAAELLGIPYERCAQGGLFPIAYTKGTDFKQAPRKDLDTIVHWNQW
jgi:nitroreductase